MRKERRREEKKKRERMTDQERKTKKERERERERAREAGGGGGGGGGGALLHTRIQSLPYRTLYLAGWIDFSFPDVTRNLACANYDDDVQTRKKGSIQLKQTFCHFDHYVITKKKNFEKYSRLSVFFLAFDNF